MGTLPLPRGLKVVQILSELIETQEEKEKPFLGKISKLQNENEKEEEKYDEELKEALKESMKSQVEGAIDQHLKFVAKNVVNKKF